MPFRMPAEWEPHEGTWLAWPHEKSDWPGKFAAVPWIYCEIVKRLARSERVHILVNDEDSERRSRNMLRKSGADLDSVDYFLCPTDRSWTRDFCPIFVRDEGEKPVILDWHFNGWAKYPNWQADDAIPSAIARRLRLRKVTPRHGKHRIVLEGGSIDVNGKGTLLTTEECLLSDIQARNPRLTREDLENVFAEHLGITNTLWLKNGIAGDDTHGHVDDLARFTDPHTVVLASEKERGDANYEPLRENLALLKSMKDEEGQPLRVVTLPMPEPLYFDGQRLPASYANFYVANEQVLMPTFNDPNDRVALQTLAKLFPERKVSGIHATDLVLGLGTLHCLTQQQIAVLTN
ncbi:MAG: agmatine deiminase family protein [Bryobacteraceae bacterium]|nr:agmatine deiminase family protein [Bryobacteraceae bacterium]